MTTDSQPEDVAATTSESGRSFWSLFVLLAAAAAILIVLQSGRPKSKAGAYVGLPLPPLEAAGWLNTTKPLSAADLRGKVVLLDFWASDCLPCVYHIPELIELNKRFRDRDVLLVGLSLEAGPRAQHLKNFVETRDGLTWPIGYDARFAYEALNIYGTPTYLLYDRTGRSVWGGHTLDGLDDALAAALAEKK